MNKNSAEPVGKPLKIEKEYKLPTAVYSLDINSDGSNLFASCFDGGVYTVQTDSGKYEQLTKHASYASGVRYLAPYHQIVSAGYDGALNWYSLTDKKLLRSVQAHKFWSWKMRTSPDNTVVASVTGQYMVGGYKYEPAPEKEPSVRVYGAHDGVLKWSLPHTPPVLSTAFSPNSRYLAAGNLMGDVHVWDMTNGKQVSTFNSPDFTCWGIIKSHHYIGGIFDMCFNQTGDELAICGMGPMIDPMAGNGKQTWQRWKWQAAAPVKVAEIADSDAGHGLMEVVRFSPDGATLLMAGRLAQGTWNLALFSATTGKLLSSADTKMRITDVAWLPNGSIAISGLTSQERKKNGKCPDFGHIKIVSFT